MDWIRGLIRQAFGRNYRAASALIVRTIPPRLWYRTAFLVARLQVKVLCPLALIGIYPYRRDIARWSMRRKVILARIMDTWMKCLGAYRRPFPIPIRIQTEPPLDDLPSNGYGVVFCTVHCFLADAVLGAILEASGNDLTVIAAVPEMVAECPVYGSDRTVPTIPADTLVLLKAKRILERGGSVAVLVDRGIGAPLAANTLRLAHLVGARLFFGMPELQPDGEILLAGCEAPDLQAGGEESVQFTLRALDAQRSRILQLSPHTDRSALNEGNDPMETRHASGARPLKTHPREKEAAL